MFTKVRAVRAVLICFVATLGAPAFADILADSTSDFSGFQGAKSWYYGYFPGGSVNSFTQLPVYTLNSTQNFWQQTTFGLPWTLVGAGSETSPNGADSGTVQWAVREWVSTFAGSAVISDRLFKLDTSNPASTGVFGSIYLNHSQIWNQFIAGADGVGVSYSIPVTLHAGDVLDFAVAPNGSDSNDSTEFSATI
ncbi:MAG: hypothetical protein ABSC23_14530 [Bryobacteraceae bacterium]|jgi:hypothetical protein